MSSRDTDPFGDEVVYAWAMTTPPQRERCFEEFAETGTTLYCERISALLHVLPKALKLACLLEFEHESVCEPSGKPRDIHYGRLRDMMDKWQAVDNSPKPVDNSAFSVDKSVEKPVDKNSGYPQETPFEALSAETCGKPAVYPLFIHRQPVDKIL